MRVELKIDGHTITCDILKKDIEKVGLKKFTDKAIELLTSDNDDYVLKLASDVVCNQLKYNFKISRAVDNIDLDTIISKLIEERISSSLNNIIEESDKSIRYYTSEKLYDILDRQLDKMVYAKIYNQVVKKVFDRISSAEEDIKSAIITIGSADVKYIKRKNAIKKKRKEVNEG